MVFVHVKRGDKNEFLFETSVNTPNEQLIRTLCQVHNERLRLAALVDALPHLAKHGVAKKPGEEGLDEYQEDNNQKQRGEYYDADPLGKRTGEGVGPHLTQVLQRVADDAKSYIDSKQQMQSKTCMDLNELRDKLLNIQGAITMAFPQGLPPHDPVKQLIESKSVEEALANSSASLEVAPEDSTELWWAGKQFFPDQFVKDLVGKNEKTKIICKLQKKGGGMPGREPAVSEDERKAMMAFYFKKQEEQKKAAENDDEDYLTSTWADPRALQNSLRGTQNIRPF